MYEDIGLTFSKVRDEKKISVNDIVKNQELSKSQYYRFVKQESDISLTKFLNLLENLNVQFEEFIYLLPESKDDLRHLMGSISDAFHKYDDKKLKELQEVFSKTYSASRVVKYLHLSIICECLRKRITHDHSKTPRIHFIVDYLRKVDTWHHYELVLFANTFFAFDLKDTLPLLNTAKKKAEAMKDYLPYMKESIRLHSNIAIHLLELGDFKSTLVAIRELEKIEVGDDHIYEKILLKFWKKLANYIQKPSAPALLEVHTLLENLRYFDCLRLEKMLSEITNYTVYAIPYCK